MTKYKDYMEHRAITIANYIINTKCTVREAAKVFAVSKSTVHKDMTLRLPFINKALAREVFYILDINKQERHIRGGKATKALYLHIVENDKLCC